MSALFVSVAVRRAVREGGGGSKLFRFVVAILESQKPAALIRAGALAVVGSWSVVVGQVYRVRNGVAKGLTGLGV